MNKIAKRIMTTVAAFALVVVLGVCLTACGGSKDNALSAIDYYNRMDDAGYAVNLTNKAYQNQGADDEHPVAEWAIQASKIVDEDTEDETRLTAMIAKYADETEAEKAEEELKKYIEESSYMKGYIVVRDGTMIFAGDQASINIALCK